MVTCPLCGSEEVYRSLDKRRRFWTWYAFLWLLVTFPILALIPLFALGSIPFFGETVCRNCGLILSRDQWQAGSSPSQPTAT